MSHPAHPPALTPTDACVPLGLQVVIDDVGWWCGTDGGARGEPFRTGCARDHVVADYAAIADLGQQLGMRPQAAFILCEWDRTNLLRALPSSTWLGAAWDNHRWQGPWLDAAAALLRDRAAHLELALHGIGHEFWDAPRRFTRAEWHDRDGRMRPEPEVRAHLDYFRRLLNQNGLGAFPTAFVPAAFRHSFGSGLAAVLAEHGIRYASTPYASMHRTREPQDARFGVEAGVLTVDRGRDLVNWNVIGPTPAGEIAGPICGMHWPNLLHPDPARNGEVVARWVALLRPYDTRFDRLLAPDTASGFTQLVYHRWASLGTDAGGLTLDFARVDAAGAAGLRDTFWLKVRAGAAARFRADGLTILDARHEATHWRLHLRRVPGRAQARIVASLEGT